MTWQRSCLPGSRPAPRRCRGRRPVSRIRACRERLPRAARAKVAPRGTSSGDQLRRPASRSSPRSRPGGRGIWPAVRRDGPRAAGSHLKGHCKPRCRRRGCHRRGHLTPRLATDHITRGEDVGNIRAQVLVHSHGALFIQLYARALDGDAVAVRPPAGGDEEPLGARLALFTVDLHARENALAVLLDRAHLRARHDLDTLAFEEFGHRWTYLGLVAAREEAFAALDQRYFRAEAAEHLAELERDVPRADNE